MSNIEDMKSVRSFLLKLSDGRTLRLVEKKNYDRLVERIKELEEALLKVKDKNTTLFITCRNSIPRQKVKDVLAEIQKEYEKLDKASDEFLSNKEKTVEDYVLEKERLATMQTLAYCRDNLEELLEESK